MDRDWGDGATAIAFRETTPGLAVFGFGCANRIRSSHSTRWIESLSLAEIASSGFVRRASTR
jgi:hypothetical protein